MKSIAPLFVMVALSVLIVWAASFADDGKFVPLFDGKSLDGWTVKGGWAPYIVEDNMIVGTTSEGSPNTFLCKGPFGDFELQFDVLCDVELNSGVQIRSHIYEEDTPFSIGDGRERMAKAGEVYGYQVEITHQSRGVAGGIYDERRRGWIDDLSDNGLRAKQAFKNGEWNHYRIVARGDRIQTWINGVPCADLQDSMDSSGFIGLQVHSIRGGDTYKVRWKNINIKEL